VRGLRGRTGRRWRGARHRDLGVGLAGLRLGVVDLGGRPVGHGQLLDSGAAARQRRSRGATAATFCPVASSAAVWARSPREPTRDSSSERIGPAGSPSAASASGGSSAATRFGAARNSRSRARHARQLRRCGRRARRSSAEASPSASAESCGASRSHSAPDSIPARPLKNAFRPSVRAIDLGVAPRGQPTMRAASEPYHYGVVVRQIGRQSGSVAVSAMRRRPSAVWTPGIGLSA
jgi:hypothetical protein